MPVIALFTEGLPIGCRIACSFEIFGAIMPHGVSSGKALALEDAVAFSAKRND
jgi:hypothetical protein